MMLPKIPMAVARLASLLAVAATLGAPTARAQSTCTALSTGLLGPMGVALTPHGRLLVAEAGLHAANTGRLTIVEADGRQRTLLDGLPSGIADVGDASGPADVLLRGRTAFVAIGVGDVGVMGTNASGQPVRGSSVPNPNGPSSPLLSSVLAVHFSAEAERDSKGFTLSAEDQRRLAAGEVLTLTNGGADRVTLERIADMPNFVPWPHPVVAGNVQLSNPFKLALKDDVLYATDGGRNLVWRIDLQSRSLAPLVSFPSIGNPLFPGLGGPRLEAVPTGIAVDGDSLLVTLFRGAPFPPGSSTVERVGLSAGGAPHLDPPYIAGLKMAIGVVPTRVAGTSRLLVLQHASVGPFFGGPGLVLGFDGPAATPQLVSDCLSLPTAMARDGGTGRLFVTEAGGAVVTVDPAR